MNQTTNTSSPWWDGKIAIAFTEEDWHLILNNLIWEYSPTCGDTVCGCPRAMEIIDEIRKHVIDDE